MSRVGGGRAQPPPRPWPPSRARGAFRVRRGRAPPSAVVSALARLSPHSRPAPAPATERRRRRAVQAVPRAASLRVGPGGGAGQSDTEVARSILEEGPRWVSLLASGFSCGFGVDDLLHGRDARERVCATPPAAPATSSPAAPSHLFADCSNSLTFAALLLDFDPKRGRCVVLPPPSRRGQSSSLAQKRGRVASPPLSTSCRRPANKPPSTPRRSRNTKASPSS